MITEITLDEQCQQIYECSGQSAVLNYVARYAPDVPWVWCEPCEIDSPAWDGSCLVCGSTVGKE